MTWDSIVRHREIWLDYCADVFGQVTPSKRRCCSFPDFGTGDYYCLDYARLVEMESQWSFIGHMRPAKQRLEATRSMTSWLGSKPVSSTKLRVNSVSANGRHPICAPESSESRPQRLEVH